MKTRADKQLCWDCKNAYGNGCCWFRNFEPVDGWDAQETIIYDSRKCIIRSFKIIKCPHFVCDSVGKQKNKGRGKAKCQTKK